MIATLGMFDGLHLGHQKILTRMQELKQQHNNARAVVVSFYPHPDTILKKAAKIDRLTNARQMLGVLRGFNIDVLYLVRFTAATSSLSAGGFIDECLFEKLNTGTLVLGEDARFGKGGQGDPQFVADYFNRFGKSVEIVNFFKTADQKVSSSIVRALLTEGKLAAVEALLGRHYSVEGRVVHGSGRGGPLGTPTANLKPTGKVLPKNGVYATYVHLRGERFRAATNVGVRPTFNAPELCVESLLIDYSGASFYGAHIEVEFVERIRDEIKFPSLEQLRQRILKDVAAAGKILA